MSERWVATPRLRWLTRAGTPLKRGRDVTQTRERVLQQFYAEPMPEYMRDMAQGEWRDVPVVGDEP
jgi:hypothetical protein